jgi:hypothetical protein
MRTHVLTRNGIFKETTPMYRGTKGSAPLQQNVTDGPYLETSLSYSSVVQRWAMGWMIGGSSPGKGWEFFSSPPRPDRL